MYKRQNISSVDAGVKRKFGELLMEVDVAKNWVHGLSWSPSCASLAVCAHDSCLHVIDLEGQEVGALSLSLSLSLPLAPPIPAVYL